MKQQQANPIAPAPWRLARGRSLALDRPRLLGILNVTPDSFSDGGAFREAGAAFERGMQLIAHGADVIDIGGESTRPGARPVRPDEQIRRTIPVIRRIRARSDAFLSIDTTCAAVARAALDAGADIINDTSAGRDDPAMLALAAERGCGLILMHRLRAPASDSFSDQYAQPPEYADVVATVREFLAERAAAAISAGVARESIIIDPGLGFGKSVEQNFELAARIGEFQKTGHPVLSAASRKSFIGRACGIEHPAERVPGSIAVSVAHYLAGVRLFRVHDVQHHREALAVAAAIARACSRSC